MAELTPLEKLDAAIAEYIQEIEETEPISINWILGYEISGYNEDATTTGIGYQFGYTTSPAFSPAASYGLATLTANQIKQDITGEDE